MVSQDAVDNSLSIKEELNEIRLLKWSMMAVSKMSREEQDKVKLRAKIALDEIKVAKRKEWRANAYLAEKNKDD